MNKTTIALIWTKLCKLPCKVGFHKHSGNFETEDFRGVICIRCGDRRILELKSCTMRGYCDSHKQDKLKPIEICKCCKEE
jgi:hypothetical protein